METVDAASSFAVEERWIQMITRRAGFTLIELLIVIMVIGLLAAIIIPNFLHARNSTKFAACSQNLKNMAVALQAYANDNEQIYPSVLGDLTPHYLEALPTCPSTRKSDSYVAGYLKSDLPSTYTVYCKGRWHVDADGAPEDRPMYVFELGLQP